MLSMRARASDNLQGAPTVAHSFVITEISLLEAITLE
jgi:hypothetical protein